jgi:branched-chain amino acid transport system substrate-binding protein
VEAQACADASRVFQEHAEAFGFELAWQGKASVAQPDYTAECLSARNAGANVLWVLLDGNAVSRLAASCARQGYGPLFAIGSSIVTDRFVDDPSFDSLIASSPVFPYFQSDTPATREFQTAARTLGGGITPSVGVSTGWTSGKLLERAALGLPEPPSSEALLAGLWSIQHDTLGGITQPLTFTKGEPPAEASCWFDLTMKDGAWKSPDAFKLHCA